MSTYSKKKEQQITFFMQVSFLIAALAGWFLTKSIGGLVGTLLFWFGLLVFIMLTRKRRKDLLLDQTGVGKVDFMDQKEFEQYLMDFFKGDGYAVKHTPANKAAGATFTMTKRDELVAVFVQASDKVLDLSAIQQIVATLPTYADHQVWAITNYQYNAAAIGLALQNQIVPLDRDDLLEKAVLR